MPEKLFARTDLHNLLADSDILQKNGLCPEVYISAEELAFLAESGNSATAKLMRSFAAGTVHAPFIDLYPGSIDAQVRSVCFSRLKKTMALAREWNCFLVVAHLNYNPVYYSRQQDEWLDNCRVFFRELLAAEPGPLLALENVAEKTPEWHRKVIRAVASERLTACLDLGHLHVFSSLSPAEWLEELGNVSHLHFHFHDNHGDYDSHSALGRGNIAWGEIAALLERLETPFSITLEAHTRADLLASLSYFREVFKKKLDSKPEVVLKRVT